MRFGYLCSWAEELSFPEMAIWAVGLMNAVGNLPLICWRKCARQSGTMITREGQDLHQRLLEINQAVFYDTNPIPIKYMMKRLGIIPENEHRLPMSPTTPSLRRAWTAFSSALGYVK